MRNETKLFSDETVQSTLLFEELIPAMDQVFRDLSAGALKMLPRSALFHENGNIFAVMPASIPRLGVCGCKTAIFPGKVTASANTQQSVVLLFDIETGALRSIVCAEHITMMRTAAASAAATDRLACPDASVLCLLGSGRQAIGHARAIRQIRPIREVRIWSPNPVNAQAACDVLKNEGFTSVHAAVSAEMAVRGAQIVCTVSKAKEPILFGDWLSPGAHVNAVGACNPFGRELDVSVLKRGRVYVDELESVISATGDLLLPIRAGEYARAEIAGEIGAVGNGTCPGREAGDKETVTVFESCGLAVQDVAAASLVAENASEFGAFCF